MTTVIIKYENNDYVIENCTVTQLDEDHVFLETEDTNIANVLSKNQQVGSPPLLPKFDMKWDCHHYIIRISDTNVIHEQGLNNRVKLKITLLEMIKNE